MFLWCEGDTTFSRENFSGNSHPQGRVWSTLETEFALCQFRGANVKNIPDSTCADADAASLRHLSVHVRNME
jgi:hypothetical protein